MGEELEHYHGKKHNHESYSASVNSVEEGGRERGRGGAGQDGGSAKLEESDSEAGINQSAPASSHVNILHLLLRGGVLVYLIFVKSLSYKSILLVSLPVLARRRREPLVAIRMNL